MQALGHKTWRPTLVIPRSLCVFESLPCAGLAWHERKQFARMQASRLAPFKESGSNAAVAGGRLMLWFWNKSEVSTAMRSAGLNPADYRFVVESLLRKLPGTPGLVEQACWGGSDRLDVINGGIAKSTWQNAIGAVATSAIPSSTWAPELLNSVSLASQSLGRLEWLRSRQILLPLLSGALVTGTGVYASYWGGVYLGTQQRLTQIEQQAEVADNAIGNLLTLKQSVASNERWVNNYSRLAASVEFDRLLESLALLMERHGVVVREFELRQTELRLAVSSAGGDIDLPRLLESLTALPGVIDVQLRDNVELTQAGFSLRVPGYLSLLTPDSANP